MTVTRLIPLIDGHLHFNTISTVVRELDRIWFLSHDNDFHPVLYYPKVMKDEYITLVNTNDRIYLIFTPSIFSGQ